MLALFAALFVNLPVVDVQHEPYSLASVETQIIYGSEVKPQEERGKYVRIKHGWIPKSALIERDAYKGDLEVQVSWEYIYSQMDTSPHPPIMALPYETKIEKVSQEDKRWYKVRLLDGTEAYAQVEDFVKHDVDIIAFAKSFLGLPYRWGGASAFGYDCSAYVQMLYRRIGIEISRNSSQQKKEGYEVDEPKPLDLVFFKGHVGMYIGENEFIHADTLHGRAEVRIDDLDQYAKIRPIMAIRRYR